MRKKINISFSKDEEKFIKNRKIIFGKKYEQQKDYF